MAHRGESNSLTALTRDREIESKREGKTDRQADKWTDRSDEKHKPTALTLEGGRERERDRGRYRWGENKGQKEGEQNRQTDWYLVS